MTSYLHLIRTSPKQLLFGFNYIFFSALGQTYVFALFVPHIEKTFELPPVTLSSYYGIVTLMGGFLLVYTGSLIDRVNIWIYSIVCVSLLAWATIWISHVKSLIALVGGLFLLRHIGQGLMTHIGLVATTRSFMQMRGRALSLVNIGMSLSTMVMPPLTAWLIQTHGWQTAFVQLGILTFCCCAFLTIFMFPPNTTFFKKAGKRHSVTPTFLEKKELNWSRKELLSHSHFWLILPITVTPGYLITALFFHQGTLGATQGWSTIQIANGFGAYGLVAFISSFLAGHFVDAYSGQKVQKFLLFPFILSLTSLFISSHPLMTYIYLGLMGFGIAFTSSSTAMWAEVYGNKHLGAIKSLISMLTIAATAIAPIIFSYLLSRGLSIHTIILGHIYYLVFATLCAFLAKPPQIQA